MIDSNETLAYESGRNAGYAEGYEDGLMIKVEKLEPHPTEAIVVSFSFDNIDLDDMQELFRYIESKFPNNAVVAIPDYIGLQSCGKDVLKNVISMIAEIIEGL